MSIIENQLTKEEFLKLNKKIIEKNCIPIDGKQYVEGILGSNEDCEKVNFTGVYVLLERNKVFYVGSALPNNRTIKVRFKEHKYGHHSNSKIVRYLMDSRNLTQDEARDLVKTFTFLAFKYKSFEYELINNTPYGLINKDGYYKK